MNGSVWNSKPPVGTPINWSHPLASAGLVYFSPLWDAPGTKVYDAVNPTFGAPFSGSPTWGGGVTSGLSCAGTSGNVGVSTALPAWLKIQAPLTLAVAFRRLGTPVNFGGLFGLWLNNTNASPFLAAAIEYTGTAGATQISYTINSGATNTFSATGFTAAVGADHVLVFTIQQSLVTTWNFYADGAPVNSGGASSLPSWTYSATSLLGIGNYASSANLSSNSLIYWTGIWNQSLPAPLIQDYLSSVNSPWQMFGVPQLWKSSVASGSVGTAAGSSTSIGVGASLDRSVGSAAGSSTASSVGASFTRSTATAVGSSTASGSSAAPGSGTGTAVASSSSSAVGASVVFAMGVAPGSSAVNGQGMALAVATGVATGSSTASGVGSSGSSGSIGTAAGSSTATAASNAPATFYSSLQAIQIWWATRTDLQALVTNGKLWHKSAPENASQEPYLTYFLVSEPKIAQTTGFAIYETTIQFGVHHFLPGLAQAIAWQIATAMDTVKSGEIALVIEGTQAMHVLADSFGIDEGEGLGYGGRDCWICHFEVSIPWTN